MKHIIIVDDDPAILDAFGLIFNAGEYRITVFSNGAPMFNNAFDIPDLFILDKQLSGVDGLDVCRFLKSQQQTMHIPVIMLSASLHLQKNAMAAGADAVLEKPFKIQALREMVVGFLS
jgi:DNA-binding response OmpR family regulator